MSTQGNITKRCLLFLKFGFISLLFVSAFANGQSASVGFAKLQINNGTEPALKAGIWYPTDAKPSSHSVELMEQTVAEGTPVKGHGLPLVVLSHGGGGSYASHYDTALALAHAGFVVAAISHTGDTYDDQSKVLQLWRRPQQLQTLISYMLQDWPQHELLDINRIGAFGYSNGGFTVLVAAGGVPDLRMIGPYCRIHPGQDLCVALKGANVDIAHLYKGVPASYGWAADPRIKAVVIAAPAFAFTFTRDGLTNVHIPIQLWRAADDHHQPNPYYEETLRRLLPQAPEYHVVSGAGHFDFLPPCSTRLAAINPLICKDPSNFNRITFHEDFNSEIVRFFSEKLKLSPR